MSGAMYSVQEKKSGIRERNFFSGGEFIFLKTSPTKEKAFYGARCCVVYIK